MTENLTLKEQLMLCLHTLEQCFYRYQCDMYCGYGERAKDNYTDIVETLQALEPERLRELDDRAHFNMSENEVSTHA